MLAKNSIILRMRGSEEGNMQYQEYERLEYTDKVPVILNYNTKLSQDLDYIHWHESLEILYFQTGNGIVYSDNEKIYAYPGDIIVINSSNIHNVRSITQSSKYYCMLLDKSFCEAFGFSFENFRFSPKMRSDKLAKQIKEIVAEYGKGDEDSQIGLKILLLSLILEMKKRYAVPGKSMADIGKTATIKKSIRFIRSNFTEHITLDDIAAHVGLNKYYLSHAFKEVTDTTVIHFINTLRCNYAIQLMNSGTHSISEISEACGFDNPSYFTKVFKKYKGTLPSKAKGK